MDNTSTLAGRFYSSLAVEHQAGDRIKVECDENRVRIYMGATYMSMSMEAWEQIQEMANSEIAQYLKGTEAVTA